MPSLDDFHARLRTAIIDADRQIHFIIGAGMSKGAVPDVRAMVEIFINALPPAERKSVRQLVEPLSPGAEQYQEAASLLLARGGAKRVREALCVATLKASLVEPERLANILESLSTNELRQIEKDENLWRITDSHRAFAGFYAMLPSNIRGHIYTTNFDPLIEVALAARGMECEPLPIAGTAMPTREQLAEKTATPVFHLHGFWRSSNSLHTTAQLARVRPAIEQLINQSFSNSIIISVGYGGWEDVFMRALKSAIVDGQLYDSELCWTVYSQDHSSIQKHPELAGLYGLPGCNFYFDVSGQNAFTLHDLGREFIDEISAGDQASPDGYTIIKPSEEVRRGAFRDAENLSFIDGYDPEWRDAVPDVWPALTATTDLANKARNKLQNLSGCVAAIGPIGEGKSLALRQVALTLAAEREDWTFLWREHGAPRLTGEWLKDAWNRFGAICVMVDSADLIIEEVASAFSAIAEQEGIVLLVACHDRVWWTSGRAIAAKAVDVLFHGITNADAMGIAKKWSELNALPPAFALLPQTDAIEKTASKLYANSRGIEGSNETTLIGAILSTRSAEGLQNRIGDLLDKFSSILLLEDESITMLHVFGAICVIQDVHDPDGTRGQGISREVLAALVDANGDSPNTKIITILGREALVTFAGERIYCRHASIAHHAVLRLRLLGEMSRVCWLIGRAGARIRAKGEVNRNLWTSAYQISKSLADPDEALAAADGVLRGAPKSFQARLDRITVLRGKKPQYALDQAKVTLRNRSEFDDVDECIRIFLNEVARCAIQVGEPESALGAAAIGLGGRFRYELGTSPTGYFFKSFLDASMMLRRQNGPRSSNIPELSWGAARSFCSSTEQRQVAGTHAVSELQIEQSSSSILASLQRELLPFARSAAVDLSVQQHFAGSLNFSWLGTNK
ncbi:P-loop NTPase [Williamsia sp. Leaf354]|uniref:P-loop NTPase n=1 Tax=Williamsia sp. Leaf354 TaxID=1736349 RepID=UPI00138F803C|nr:SIR2 family protein [Williamsia sp. Leaf354]